MTRFGPLVAPKGTGRANPGNIEAPREAPKPEASHFRDSLRLIITLFLCGRAAAGAFHPNLIKNVVPISRSVTLRSVARRIRSRRLRSTASLRVRSTNIRHLPIKTQIAPSASFQAPLRVRFSRKAIRSVRRLLESVLALKSRRDHTTVPPWPYVRLLYQKHSHCCWDQEGPHNQCAHPCRSSIAELGGHDNGW